MSEQDDWLGPNGGLPKSMLDAENFPLDLSTKKPRRCIQISRYIYERLLPEVQAHYRWKPWMARYAYHGALSAEAGESDDWDHMAKEIPRGSEIIDNRR